MQRLYLSKAFDTISHSNLLQKLPQYGIKDGELSWFTDYLFHRSAAVRYGKSSSKTSDIQTGVPQGSILGPLLFIIFFNDITDVIEGARVVKYADDTVIYLSGYAQLPRMWELIDIWEQATGLRLNKSKTEALALGKLKGTTFTGPGSEGIGWVKPGDHLISLGIPIGVDFDPREFFRAKYFKCKSLLANWLSLAHVTPFGRAMLANSLVFSRFRYWAQSMAIPSEIMAWLEADTQALIWDKNLTFDPDEKGTVRESRRFMLEGAQYKPKSELGLGTSTSHTCLGIRQSPYISDSLVPVKSKSVRRKAGNC